MAFNLAKCQTCGECLAGCHYSEYNCISGGVQIKELIYGSQAQILSECVTCAACNTTCDRGANPFDLIMQRLEEYECYQVTPAYQRLVELIDKSPGSVVAGEYDRPAVNVCVINVIPGLLDGELFAGCTILSGGKFESALGAIHAGKESQMKETLAEKIAALAHTGMTEIVMLHDDCYGAYTTKALEYGIPVPFKVTHYVEYLLDYLKKAPTVRRLDMKIAYQQPCSSRYSPWIDQCLDELFELIGVDRVNRQYDRKNALCCGCPVAPRLGHQVAEVYKNKNIEDAVCHGADAMVFMCPFCTMQMRDEVHDAGMAPIFLTGLARMALGETLTTHPSGLGDDRDFIQTTVKIIKGLN